MRKANNITKEELLVTYIENESGTVRAASKVLGCSMTTFLKALKHHGLEPKLKTRSWHRSGKFPQLSDAVWLADQLQTKTMNQVAAELGTTNGNVADHAYRLGIRDRGVDRSVSVKAALRLRFGENGRAGAAAANWRGGRRYTGGGHVYVHSPNHPFASDGGYVMEHRLVVEKSLGRYLTPDEIVHHKNGIKDDNGIENLEVMTKAEHLQKHFAAVGEAHKLAEENERLKQLLKQHGIEDAKK